MLSRFAVVADVDLRGAPDACGISLREPDPDPALEARARALDRGAEPDPNLGHHFAQQVVVACER